MILRGYHGCSTADAGIYHREELRTNDRGVMTERLRVITDGWQSNCKELFDFLQHILQNPNVRTVVLYGSYHDDGVGP